MQYTVPWVPMSPQIERHLDWFSRFAGYARDQQTDKPRYMCNNEPHFMLSIAMWPNNYAC